MINKKMVALSLVAMMALAVPFCEASAEKVYVTLPTDETSASSPYLGNTTGKYRLVGAVSATSLYSVDYYIYKAATTSSNMVVHSNFSYNNISAFDKSYTIDKSYTVAKCTIYGNKKSNPKKECYANAILSNN